MTVATGPDVNCRIYVQPLHARFVRPWTPEDVAEVLTSLPPDFLNGLEGVLLLGGTRKQDAASNGLFRIGAYGDNKIYLHAFPQRHMQRRYKHPPKPSIVQEYTRAGVVWEQTSNGWTCRFTEQSLRTFYLKDVLIHEIGHHVDRHRKTSDGVAEKFAEGFVRMFGYPRADR